MPLKRYDKYEKYRGESPVPMALAETEGKVFNCSDCGLHHKHIEFKVDNFGDKYFICPMTKNEVDYK